MRKLILVLAAAALIGCMDWLNTNTNINVEKLREDLEAAGLTEEQVNEIIARWLEEQE